MTIRPIIAIVDDDESVRESLPDLLALLGYSARAFASAEEFLRTAALAETRGIILDVAMPDMTGPELYRELLARGHAIPVIFISAHFDASVRSDLIEQGAIACLSKPFGDKELGEALQAAVRVT
jgi:FixJ family two-component response regulator